jgi:predicted nuclease of predicted toxin-antitoxin system
VAALRFKLDENVPIDAGTLLVGAGYECHTVYDEHLDGASDPDVAQACRVEGRVLVTLGLDFSDVRAYPPGTHAGIVVLRPRAPDRDSTLALVERMLPLLTSETLTGCLWVVDTERVRVRAPRP